MKVTLLYVHDVSYPQLVGVFSTKKNAKQFYHDYYYIKAPDHKWDPIYSTKTLDEGQGYVDTPITSCHRQGIKIDQVKLK